MNNDTLRVPNDLLNAVAIAITSAPSVVLHAGPYSTSHQAGRVLFNYLIHARQDLEVFTMTENPETCPHCATRTETIETSENASGTPCAPVVEFCPGCGFVYRLEE